MLRWLTRLWSRDRGRLLFEYHDGARQRWCDPIAAHKALDATCPDWGELFVTLATDPKTIPAGPLRKEFEGQVKDARSKLLAATRVAFGVAALNDTTGSPTGLTEGETVGLFQRFMEWVIAEAEAAAPFVTSQEPGADSLRDSPTAPSAASGSAAG